MPTATPEMLRARLRRGLLGGAAVVLLGLIGTAVAYKAGLLWFVRPSWTRYPVRGVDVSHHQGEIAWEELVGDDYRFAWIKATEGADWTDPNFDANRAGAAAAGLAWGPYHFYGFCSPPEAQAAHFLAVLGDHPGALPPAVDVEKGGNCSQQPSPEKLRADLETWLHIVETALHRQAVVYVLNSQVGALFGEAGPPDRPLWVRDLRARPSLFSGRSWTVWQYHNCGWVWGVHTCADLNAFAGDEAAFERWVEGENR